MNFDSTAQALRTFFLSGWAASAYSAVPIYQSNRAIAPTTGQNYIRMSVLPLNRWPVSYGRVNQRTEGAIYFQIFVPNGSGDGLPRKYADAIGVILENQTVSGISIRAVNYIGEIDDDGAWTMYNVRADYTVDELK